MKFCWYCKCMPSDTAIIYLSLQRCTICCGQMTLTMPLKLVGTLNTDSTYVPRRVSRKIYVSRLKLHNYISHLFQVCARPAIVTVIDHGRLLWFTVSAYSAFHETGCGSNMLSTVTSIVNQNYIMKLIHIRFCSCMSISGDKIINS